MLYFTFNVNPIFWNDFEALQFSLSISNFINWYLKILFIVYTGDEGQDDSEDSDSKLIKIKIKEFTMRRGIISEFKIQNCNVW